MKLIIIAALLGLISFGCATDACFDKSCSSGDTCELANKDGSGPTGYDCSTAYDGAVCCSPSGGGTTVTTHSCTCPSSARWNCGGCYATPPAGNHNCFIPAGC